MYFLKYVSLCTRPDANSRQGVTLGGNLSGYECQITVSPSLKQAKIVVIGETFLLGISSKEQSFAGRSTLSGTSHPYKECWVFDNM